MIQFLAILHVLLCFSSAATFIPSSFGSHKRQTWLFAVDDHHPLDRDDMNLQNDPYYKLFRQSEYSLPRFHPEEQVYIILFKPGTPDEGAHTIEYPNGSGNYVILAFLSEHECDKFANLLREQEISWDPMVRTQYTTLETSYTRWECCPWTWSSDYTL